MTNRGKHLRTNLIAGIALTLVIVDLLALRALETQLAAVHRTDRAGLDHAVLLADAGARQALIVPTHDPSKPWPTRRPTLSPTSWLVLPATAVPQAALEPTEEPATVVPATALAAAQPTTTPEPSPIPYTPQDAPAATISIDQIVTAPTPTPIGYSVVPSPVPTPLPTSTESPVESPPPPIDSPPDLEPATSTATPEATATPTAPPPFAAGDEAQFVAYVQGQYNSIVGQALDIASVSLIQAADGRPGAIIEIIGDAQNNAFATQPAAAEDYGRRLLDDTKFFLAGQACAIQVVVDFDTFTLEPCIANPGLCFLNGLDSTGEGWSIGWIYVMGTFDGESNSVEVLSPDHSPN